MSIRTLSLLAAATMLALPATAQTQAPVPIATLVKQVAIPWQGFTLPNGLRVIVHTDRKAPVVAVSIWYHIGSKDEPAGQTGFAHLYEHLMFNGSENSPGDFFKPLQDVGATDVNGTTWFDRTNYFETVPTPALPFALFLESDRMGHLLGAIGQTTLDVQRGVVQNEKRQGDNEPYGLVEYAQLAATMPPGHPYGHPTIGSMADLDKASLETVKGWFRANYGPNNAVLVLAGDIDVATAKPMVERYFGDIPRGPEVTHRASTPPRLARRKEQVMTDRVAQTRLYRSWWGPGITAPDLPALDVGASVLGGLSSSRLDNALVRNEKLAVGVTAGVQAFEQISQFEVTVDVKPGVDPAIVAKRLDALLADYIAKGPTQDEVQRAVMREVTGRIGRLESVGGFGGKAVTLAEGALYAGDPDFSVKQLGQYAALTPAAVQAALKQWVASPPFVLTVKPGARTAYEEAAGGQGSFRPAYFRTPAPGEQPLAPSSKLAFQAGDAAPGAGTVARPQNPAEPARVAPTVGAIRDLDFPKIEHAALSNGIKVDYAQRTAVPFTRLAIAFDAGNAADPKDKLGLQSLMLGLLDEGTTTRSSIQIAEEEERLGMGIGAAPSMDQTVLSLSALSANLAPSLDLFADILKNPAFKPEEIERVRAQQLAGIASEQSRPQSLALRTLPPLLYGKAHPYGVPFSGSGDPAAVAKVTRADMISFKDAWFRPEKARISIVSDRPLAELVPLLEARFGTWTVSGAAGVKPADSAIPAQNASRILLIDQPDSPQSLIIGGHVSNLPGTTDDMIGLAAANDVMGGDFLSRLNTDLRETKHYSYGVSSQFVQVRGQMPFLVLAPVQANKTGESLGLLVADMKDFLGPNGVKPDELTRTINGKIRELPGSFETGGAVLTALRRMVLFNRPDDYYGSLAGRYRALTAADLDRLARATITPDKMLWVVVGDAKAIRPQLEGLGLPIEVMAAKGVKK